MTAPFKVPGVPGLEPEALEFYRVLNEEKNDLACVLLTLGFLDLCLHRLLKSFLIGGSTTKGLLKHTGPLGSFNARAELSYSLGLISKGVKQNLEVLGDMR